MYFTLPLNPNIRVVFIQIYRTQTKIEPGELIVIKAKKDPTSPKRWIIDNNDGFLINQPDTLISGTSVVGARWCNRRSIFSEKFRGIDSLPYYDTGSPVMLIGNFIHELLQKVIRMLREMVMARYDI